MHYEWLKPFVGGVLLMVGAWLLQPGYDAARFDIRNSRIGGPDREDVVSLFGLVLWSGGTALLLVGGWHVVGGTLRR